MKHALSINALVHLPVRTELSRQRISQQGLRHTRTVFRHPSGRLGEDFVQVVAS